jgi:hypothetical protein
MFLKHTKVVPIPVSSALINKAGNVFGSVMKFADYIDFGRSQVYRWRNKESQMSKETYDALNRIVETKIKLNRKAK